MNIIVVEIFIEPLVYLAPIIGYCLFHIIEYNLAE
jgi:hypothetical protein